MVPRLHLRDLLLRLIERDTPRGCKRLGGLSASVVGAGLIPGDQNAKGVRGDRVQRLRAVAAGPDLVLDRIERIALGDDRSRGLPAPPTALVMPLGERRWRATTSPTPN
jgi:hypothetical protein